MGDYNQRRWAIVDAESTQKRFPNMAGNMIHGPSNINKDGRITIALASKIFNHRLGVNTFPPFSTRVSKPLSNSSRA